MQKARPYIYTAVWTLAVLIIFYAGKELISHQELLAKENWGYSGQVWAWTIIPFVLGVAVSFMEGWPKRFNFRLPLFLFVFLPSFFVLIYPVLAITLKLSTLPIGLFVYFSDKSVAMFAGVVSGLSLMRALFSRD